MFLDDLNIWRWHFIIECSLKSHLLFAVVPLASNGK